MKFYSCLGKILLGCAGIYTAVWVNKLYFSNKNKDESMVKLDSLLMFYEDNESMTPRIQDFEVH